MKVILFEIGNFPIRSYGLIVVLAILLATGVAYYLARNTKYQKHISDMVLTLSLDQSLVLAFGTFFSFNGNITAPI
jgi:prolipoprotein diacylglyceryltransferase